MACECGCGEDTLKSSFKPGHDQKLRASLERRVGGLSNLRALVNSAESFNAGSSDATVLAATISKLFNQR
jgi:hypothetical protein